MTYLKKKQTFTIFFRVPVSYIKKKKGFRQNKQENYPTAKEGRKALSLIKLRTKYVFKQAKILENECFAICDMKTLSPQSKNKEK